MSPTEQERYRVASNSFSKCYGGICIWVRLGSEVWIQVLYLYRFFHCSLPFTSTFEFIMICLLLDPSLPSSQSSPNNVH